MKVSSSDGERLDKTSKTPKSTSFILKKRITTDKNAFVRNRNNYIAKGDCSFLDNMPYKVTREKVHIQLKSMQNIKLASNPTSGSQFLSETSSGASVLEVSKTSSKRDCKHRLNQMHLQPLYRKAKKKPK